MAPPRPFRHTSHTLRGPIGSSTEGSSGRVRMRTRVHLGTPLKRSLAAQSHCPRPGHCALHGKSTAEFRLAPSGPAARGRGCELSWIYPTEDSQAPLFLLLLSLPSSSCSAAHSAFAIAFPHQFRVVRVRAHWMQFSVMWRSVRAYCRSFGMSVCIERSC